jgi:LEA14-like dessication related protein
MRAELVVFLLLAGLLTLGCLQKVAERIKTPEADLSVRVGGISDNSLELFIEAKIRNPNPISIDMEDLRITMKGEGGNVLQEAVIAGGTIPGNGERTFSSKVAIPLSIITEKTILTDIQTRVGAAGIDVKLPVQAKATIQLPDLESMLRSPQVSTFVKIEGITEDGLEISIETTFKNPNEIGVVVGDIGVVTESEGGERYVETVIAGGTIGAGGEHTFSKPLVIPVASVNEEVLLTRIETEVGAEGIEFRLPVVADVKVQIPRLGSLVKPPGIHTDITIRAGERKAEIKVKITNENAFGFIIGDVDIEVFDKDNRKIGEGRINGGTVSGNSEKTFSGEVTLDKTLSKGDKTTTAIKTDAGLEGVKEKIPIETTVTVTVEAGVPMVPAEEEEELPLPGPSF